MSYMKKSKLRIKEKLESSITKVKEKLMFWKKKEKEKFDIWKEMKDWVIAFVVAAVVYFILLPALLGTSSPMIVVSSCSEQGYMNIGDILFIQGINIKDINAPTIEIDKFDDFTPLFDENREVTRLDIEGEIVMLHKEADIIVYRAYPSGAQIIHRVFAKIKVGDEYYLITKGDSNLIPDQLSISGETCVTGNPRTCISTPITQNMLLGKKILFPIPLLGHVKLFFCDIVPFCDGHSNPGTNYEYKLWC